MNIRQAIEKLVNPSNRKCEYCGGRMAEKNQLGGKPKKYCSHNCAVQGWRRRHGR